MFDNKSALRKNNAYLEGIKRIINNSHGTNYMAHREEVAMLWERIKKFWKVGLIKKHRESLLFSTLSIIVLVTAGCSNESPEMSDIGITVVDREESPLDESDFADAESIAAVYSDLFGEALETNTLGSLETMKRIVSRLGENGYVAIDDGNQVDMVRAEQVVEFCKAVDEKKNAKLTIIVVTDLGFRKFDLDTKNGNVNIVRGYYQYDNNGYLQNRSTVSYSADIWQYTEEGYLLFEGSYFSNQNFVLTLSDGMEHTALRILPLDEECRELNRKYILSVGYGQNNIFLTDWNEEDFGNLDFYDIFDNFYPLLYERSVPYVADDNVGLGALYQIPEDVFENVIMAHFNIDKEILRSKTIYSSEDMAYEYRPRGFYEAEYPDIPYPEVVNYEENQDGTITLIINAVYPNENTSMAFSHKTIIRPISEEYYQYVSNQMISLEEDYDTWWHSNRLTKEEWNEIYGGNE